MEWTNRQQERGAAQPARRSPWRVRAAAAAALAAGALGGACGAAQPPVRVVLVTLDTLRADALTDERMPNLAALAGRGLSFTESFASSSTTQPTHASLFTGQAPWTHGVTRNGVVLADTEQTLAEHLRSLGFSTHAVVASFPLHSMFGFAQGFDVYEDAFDEPYVQVWEGRRTEAGTFFSLAESVTGRALAALDAADERGDARQFFWFHYFDPHDPYGDAAGEVYPIQRLLQLVAAGDPSVDAELGRAREGYQRDLLALDASLGRLLARLEADAERIATHVVVTADHGESFGERGALGHGKRVTREQVQVPLFFVSPGLAPGVRADLVVSSDVPRTLLELAGLPAGPLGGRNLLVERDAEAVFGMRRTFAEQKPELLLDGTRRVLPEHWFFTVREDGLWSGNADQALFEDDLEAAVTGARAAELTRAFAGLQALVEAAGTGQELLDPEVQEALRALGYTR